MTYLEARQIEAFFRRYRQLAVEYWSTVEHIQLGPNAWMAGPDAPTQRETESSQPLRSRLSTLQPEAQHYASRIGANVTGSMFPAPAVGGPVVPFNLVGSVVDRRVGHRTVPPDMVLDAIDRCIGAAEFHKRRSLARLLKPWYWLVDAPALIVGWPFAVMRRAGVPDAIIDGTGAQVVKAIMSAAISVGGLVWAAYGSGLLAAIGAALGW